MILDANGRPYSSTPEPAVIERDIILPELCPQCGEGSEKRDVVQALGGYWKVLCLCGHKFDEGRGVPPLIGDLG